MIRIAQIDGLRYGESPYTQDATARPELDPPFIRRLIPGTDESPDNHGALVVFQP